MILTTEQWISERLENCERIAKLKMSVADRDSWLEDASYFRDVLKRLSSTRTEELSPWIPVSERKPHANDGHVLILIADKSVAIEDFSTGGHVDLSGNWWAGVPGNWLALAEHRWEVTHWKPEPTKPVSPLALKSEKS